jgi:hypothetical protein
MSEARAAVAGALFLALAAFLYALSWNPGSAGFLSDDAVYLLMADGFSPYRSADPALIHYVMRQSLFPPGYPLLLALFGGGSASLLASHWITTTTLVLALLVYGFWARLETGSGVAAVWLLLLFGLMPGTLLHDLELLSEFPYLLPSLVALWLAAREPTGAREYAAIALCVGFAAITRSAGLSLVLAFGLWLFFHRARGRVKWIVLALVPSATWAAFKAWAIGSQSGYGSLWLGLWEGVQRDGFMAFVPSFLVGQCRAIWSGLLGNLDLRAALPTEFVLALVLLAALPVWVRRLRLVRLDAWYLLIGGAMIFLYPFPSFFTRLLLPWVPILLLYGCLGAIALARRFQATREKPVLTYAFLAALSLVLLPSLGFVVQRFAAPVDPALAVWKHTRYWYRLQPMETILSDVAFRQDLVRAAREVPQWVPEGTCVYGVHTAITMLYGRRISQQPPAPGGDGARFADVPRACPYYFLLSTPGEIDHEPVGPFYPYDRLPADRLETVHVWHGSAHPQAPVAILLRVKPTA